MRIFLCSIALMACASCSNDTFVSGDGSTPDASQGDAPPVDSSTGDAQSDGPGSKVCSVSGAFTTWASVLVKDASNNPNSVTGVARFSPADELTMFFASAGSLYRAKRTLLGDVFDLPVPIVTDFTANKDYPTATFTGDAVYFSAMPTTVTDVYVESLVGGDAGGASVFFSDTPKNDTAPYLSTNTTIFYITTDAATTIRRRNITSGGAGTETSPFPNVLATSIVVDRGEQVAYLTVAGQVGIQRSINIGTGWSTPTDAQLPSGPPIPTPSTPTWISTDLCRLYYLGVANAQPPAMYVASRN